MPHLSASASYPKLKKLSLYGKRIQCWVFSFEIPDTLLDNAAKDCIEKTKIEKKAIDNLFDDNFHMKVENDDLTNYFECETAAKGILQEDGKFNRDALLRDIVNFFLPTMKKKGNLNEIGTKILDECIDTTGENLTKRIVNTHNCLVFSLEIPDALLDDLAKDCIEKTKIERKAIDNLLDENFRMKVDNDDLKEYFECETAAKGILQEDGKYNRDVLQRDIVNYLLPLMKKKGNLNEIGTKIMDECINTTGENLTKRIVNTHNCLVFSAGLPEALLDKATNECMEKTKIEKKDLQNILDKDFYMKIPDSSLNDFFECMVVAKGIFKEDGQINREQLHRDIVNVLLPIVDIKENMNEIANKILDECANVTAESKVFSSEIPDKLFDNAAKICMEKTKVDKKVIDNVFDENFRMKVENDDLKEYFECEAAAKGTIQEDGKYNRDALHRDIVNFLLPMMKKKGNLNEIGTKIMDECINTTGETLIKRIVNTHNCLVFCNKVPDPLHYDQATLECIEKTKTEKKDIPISLNKDDHINASDSKLNEFYECVATAKGLFKQDGQINRDNMHHAIVNVFLPVMNIKENVNEIGNKILDDCANITSDNMVTRVGLLHNCFVDAAGKYQK
ncbi:hypothetical protein FQR65_LT06840 [Abscondita terminalis]|nr:hypothetical protein FQR65_LT06840 [Abscondita terminalis]